MKRIANLRQLEARVAALKIFVSSTAYDLGALRSSLKGFIQSLGFDPVLSEYSDILYDPREHTHASCIAEVRNCDAVVLIIGSRFGGAVVPGIINELDQKQVGDILSENEDHKFSITQAEALMAFDQGVPVFAFVDSGVLHDYRVYSLNPDVPINYPSISQPDTARYIFEFISFLQNRAYGNAVISFSRMEEVTEHLRKQWAALFQRLLRESRDQREEARRIDRLSEQFDDLKSALLATVGDGNGRRIARGVVRYRRLIDFIRAIPGKDNLRYFATEFNEGWEDFLRKYVGIVDVIRETDRANYPGVVLVREDGGGYLVRLSYSALRRLGNTWDDFKSETDNLRGVLYDTLAEEDRPMSYSRELSAEEVEDIRERSAQKSGDYPSNNGIEVVMGETQSG